MDTFISKTPEETRSLGERWGRVLPAGTVVALSGDLGAGKTQLVKGMALGLGSNARVHSPTFTLLNEYGGGRVDLVHIDLYRLDTPEQVIGAGLEGYLDGPDGITVVEWAERWYGPNQWRYTAGCLLRKVQIDILSEMERRIAHEDSGA